MQTLQTQQVTISSLEVAEMVERNHFDVIRDIRKIIEHLGESKNAFTYFIESEYEDTQSKKRPCFQLTKKGCELYATRMTGAKGTQFAVQYIERFNRMEQQLQQPRLPQSYKEALQHLITQLEENEKLQTHNLVLEQRVNELQPKASYYDLILQNKTLLAISTIAKDYGMSATAMNKLLNQLGVQYKQGGIWLLYHKYQDKGYTQTATHIIDSEKSNIMTKWTQKGRLFIYELLKQHGYLPLIEKGDLDGKLQA